MKEAKRMFEGFVWMLSGLAGAYKGRLLSRVLGFGV
jgi:hypothetical protein